MSVSMWATVAGFPNYQVSWEGEVVSRARTKVRRLRPSIDSAGYPSVELYRSGDRQRVNVHRLVLEALAGPCPPGMQTRHLDGNKRNNRATNLAWGTPAENAADRARHGTIPCGSRSGSAKLTEARVREILHLYQTTCPNRAALMRQFGVSWSTINRIVQGTTWVRALAG
ncbi:HNH endonuclease signature motif containing protein [Gemmata sp.]|uniref:HNH endonuclease signature motif containing protein n=1 Tax=Gemmata sp. TaxID=1914242 RepID=UPI003F6FDC95